MCWPSSLALKRKESMLRPLTPFVLGLATLLGTSKIVRAQEMFDLSGYPMIEGPGTQGFLAYRGPAIPNFFWFCDETGGVFATIGEVAEEVHMLQGGDLASFSFAYYVNGGSVASSGTATAIESRPCKVLCGPRNTSTRSTSHSERSPKIASLKLSGRPSTV